MGAYRRKVLRLLYWLLTIFAWCSVLVFFVWSVGALYYLTTIPYLLRLLLALAYFAGAVYLFRRIKPASRWLAMAAGSVIIVYLLTLTQRPSADREWAADQSRLPSIRVVDGSVNVSDIRSSLYRSETDFDLQYRDFAFELTDLKSVSFVVQKFTVLEGVAHTFLSFEIDRPEGQQHLCVSVEVRRERDEVYSPFLGLYRQFELIYVIGDEKDVIGQRTVFRPDDRVYMYPVNASEADVQRLFLDIAKDVQGLHDRPKFYHTFLRNCTNEIVRHTYELTPEPINWLDPRIVLPGFSARFAYSQGLIGKPGQSFDELRTECRIDQRARRVGLEENFSQQIRAPLR